MQNSGGKKVFKNLLAKDPRLVCVPFSQCWHALEGSFNHSNRSVVWLRKAAKLSNVHPADRPVHAGICSSPLRLWFQSAVLKMDEPFDPIIAKFCIKKSFMMYFCWVVFLYFHKSFRQSSNHRNPPEKFTQGHGQKAAERDKTSHEQNFKTCCLMVILSPGSFVFIHGTHSVYSLAVSF